MSDYNGDIGVRYGMANCLYQAATCQIIFCCKYNTSYLHLQPNICRGEHLTCLNTVNSEMGKWTDVLDVLTNTKKKCISPCETTSFSDVTIGSSTFPNAGGFMFIMISCAIAKKLISTCSDNRKISLESKYPDICKPIIFIKENDAFCTQGAWDHNMLNNQATFNFTEFGSIL